MNRIRDLAAPRGTSRRRAVWLVPAALCVALAGRAEAQRPDSARVAAAPLPTVQPAAPVDTSLRPPLTPRRAFVYSLLAPGYAQTVLGRPTAAAVFVLAEAAAALMIFESSANLREARRLARDTVFMGTDPSGAPVRQPGAFPRGLVRARQAQVEDWIAVLLANHVFAGADAFVAAHLWDVPARVSPRTESRRVNIGAGVRW